MAESGAGTGTFLAFALVAGIAIAGVVWSSTNSDDITDHENRIQIIEGPAPTKNPDRPGEYIRFIDNFDGDDIDRTKWTHRIALGEGGYQTSQAYVDSRRTSYIQDGHLVIHPYVSDITIGTQRIDDVDHPCTSGIDEDCRIIASGATRMSTVQTASLTSSELCAPPCNIQVRAKFSNGTYLVPMIRLHPVVPKYGAFPTSGAIDVAKIDGDAVNLYADNCFTRDDCEDDLATLRELIMQFTDTNDNTVTPLALRITGYILTEVADDDARQRAIDIYTNALTLKHDRGVALDPVSLTFVICYGAEDALSPDDTFDATKQNDVCGAAFGGSGWVSSGLHMGDSRATDVRTHYSCVLQTNASLTEDFHVFGITMNGTHIVTYFENEDTPICIFNFTNDVQYRRVDTFACGQILNTTGGIERIHDAAKDEATDPLAPFNQKMYIEIGLQVAPTDGSIGDSPTKLYRNADKVNANRLFVLGRDSWLHQCNATATEEGGFRPASFVIDHVVASSP